MNKGEREGYAMSLVCIPLELPSIESLNALLHAVHPALACEPDAHMCACARAHEYVHARAFMSMRVRKPADVVV